MNKRMFSWALPFLVFFSLCLPFTKAACREAAGLDFDTQNFYYWDFLPSLNVTPFTDTFYLYGYLQYFKTATPIWFWAYALVSPLIFTAVYVLLLKRLPVHSLTRLIITACLYLVTLSTLGIGGFSRYGLLMAGSVVAAAAWISGRRLHLVIAGVVMGLMVSLATADGIYVTALSLVLLIISGRFRIRSLAWWGSGWLVGLIPLIILNTALQNWSGFIDSLRHLTTVNSYAKVPYIPRDRIQLVILLSLVAGTLTTFNLARFRSRSPLWLHLVGLMGAAVILHQKNLVRPSTSALLPYLFLVLVTGYCLSLNGRRLRPWLMVPVIVALALAFTDVAKLPFDPAHTVQTAAAYYRSRLAFAPQTCSIQTADPAKLDTEGTYVPVVNYITERYPGQKVFPFPYDPVFYVFLKQKPVPYTNFYDASSLAAQTANIRYMETAPVDVVIYDLGAVIFDASPEYVRDAAMVSYLVENFRPVTQIGSFVILERSAAGSFFQPQFPELNRRLLDLNWGEVPWLEARVKTRYLVQPDPHGSLLLLTPETTASGRGTLTLTTDAGLSSTVIFNLHGADPLLLNLANLPLTAASVSGISPPMSYQIYANPDPVLIW